MRQAFEVISETNPFPSVTGRLLSEPFQQIQVFNKNGELISVRQMERFVGDFRPRPALKTADKNRPAVAVVGSGPAGLMAAHGLIRKGYPVTVFECLPVFGGVLRYGYPEFRMPQVVVNRVIQDIAVQGVDWVSNHFFGTTVSVENLLDRQFQAVYLATGAGLSKRLQIPGENCPGVICGEEFLMNINVLKAGQADSQAEFGIGSQVVVIGNGNAALDCARISVRLGAKVRLIAKSTREDFAVRPFLVEQAQEEGVVYELLTNTVAILPDERGFVRAVKCRRLDYADTSRNEKWELVEDPGSEFEIPAQTVIVAVGHQANSLAVRHHPLIQIGQDGRVQTRTGSSMTAREGIFAGGNAVDGPGPLVSAMLSSRKAVEDIDRYLQSGRT